MIRLAALVLAGLLVALGSAAAHEIRPGYLQVDEVAPGRYEVLWRKPVLSGMPLRVELRLPDGVRDAIPPAVQVLPDSIVERRLIDAEDLAGREVAFDGMQATLTDVLVRVHLLDGSETTTLVRPAEGRVAIGSADGRLTVMVKYLATGVRHILMGVDHLLFVLGLMALVASGWKLFETITAFTVAHSVTLALATFGVVHIPVAPLNVLIALSILFLAPEMIRRLHGSQSLAIRMPWLVAFAFGLLHGFGFASGLSLTGLPTADIPLALFSFNLGVELGQLAFVALILLMAASFRVLDFRWPRFARFAPAYTVGALGAFWTIDRVASALGGLT
jgi:hypothetical protein